jgi:hypothetical protein
LEHDVECAATVGREPHAPRRAQFMAVRVWPADVHGGDRVAEGIHGKSLRGETISVYRRTIAY